MRLKDLKAENHQLELKVKRLEKLVKNLNKTHYENIPIDNKHIGLRKLDDGKYTVISKISTCDFMSNGNITELEYGLDHVIHNVKNAYTKDVIDWILETYPVSYGGIKLYPDINIPTDSIIIHPSLLYSMKDSVIMMGDNINYVERKLRSILKNAEFIGR